MSETVEALFVLLEQAREEAKSLEENPQEATSAELDELEEIRRFVVETSDPDPVTYTA